MTGLQEAHVVLRGLHQWLEKQELRLEGRARREREELVIFRSLVERAD